MVLLGVPDMGKVCAECHVPNYVERSEGLYAAGVDKIYCVAVSSPEEAEGWGQKIDLKDSKVISKCMPRFLPYSSTLPVDYNLALI